MPDVKRDLSRSPAASAPCAPASETHRTDAHDHERLNHEGHNYGVELQDGIRIALVAVAATLVWFRVWEPFARISVIGIVGTLIGTYPILKEAAENVMERRMTMELSMSIAIVAALAIGQFFTALVIVLFVLIAEVLEGLTVRRGRTAIRDLLDLLPSEVTVRRNGKTEQRSTAKISIGELIEVNPGGRIPVDARSLPAIRSSIRRPLREDHFR